MELIAFILVILFICALALPWINLARISSLQREIEALENKVESQRKELVRLEPKHANKKAQKAKQAEKTAPKPIHLEKGRLRRRQKKLLTHHQIPFQPNPSQHLPATQWQTQKKRCHSMANPHRRASLLQI